MIPEPGASSASSVEETSGAGARHFITAVQILFTYLTDTLRTFNLAAIAPADD